MTANSWIEYYPILTGDITCTAIGAYLSNAIKDTALIYSHFILNILFRLKVCFSTYRDISDDRTVEMNAESLHTTKQIKIDLFTTGLA